MTMPRPSYKSTRTVRYTGQASEIGAGPLIRRATTGRKWVEYQFVYAPGQLTEADAQDLIDQWEAAGGSAGTFTAFTPWDVSSPGEYRFLDDDLSLDVASIVAYGCTVRCEKVGL